MRLRDLDKHLACQTRRQECQPLPLATKERLAIGLEDNVSRRVQIQGSKQQTCIRG